MTATPELVDFEAALTRLETAAGNAYQAASSVILPTNAMYGSLAARAVMLVSRDAERARKAYDAWDEPGAALNAASAARAAADAARAAVGATPVGTLLAAARAASKAVSSACAAADAAEAAAIADDVTLDAVVAGEALVAACRAAWAAERALVETARIFSGLLASETFKRSTRPSASVRPLGRVTVRLVGLSVAMLPACHRGRYAEEWRGLLFEAAGRRSRARQVVSLLAGAPRQAWALRHPLEETPPA